MRYLAGFGVLVMLLVGCKEPAKEQAQATKTERAAVITFVRGNEAKIEREGSTLAAKPGEFVFAKDVVLTGPKSTVDLQLSADRLVKINEKSRLEISELLLTSQGLTNERLHLVSGGLYSKVGKLPQGASFTVRTPTVVAGVRGTEFYIESDERGRSSVAVTGGKVEVEATATGEKRVVEEGQKAEVSREGKVEEKGLVQSELAKLKNYADIKAFDQAEFTNLEEKLKDVNLLKEKKLNFNDLQKQFSPSGNQKPVDLQEQKQELKQKSEQQIEQLKSKGEDLKKSLSDEKLKGDNLKSDALKQTEELKSPDTSQAEKKVEEGKKELEKLKKKKLF